MDSSKPRSKTSNTPHMPCKLVALAILTILLSASSCAPMQPEHVLKIGALAPLTGNYATSGTHLRNGMVLAQEDLAKEGFNFTLIIEDSCFAKDAATAMSKMVEQDNIDILGGSFCLVGFVPTIPLLEQKKMIGFNTPVNPDLVLNSSYVFSTNIPIREDALHIAKFASENLHANTAALIYYTTPVGKDYAKYESLYFQAAGGKIVADAPVELSAVDFRTELTKIKEANPDVLFVTHLAGQLGTLIKQAREIGINATIMAFSEAEDKQVIAAAGRASEGLIIASAEPKEKTEQMKEFIRRYTERFNMAPTPLATNAYDSIRLQVAAYRKCEGDSECMKSALHSIKDYDGLSGRITIGQDGASLKPNLFKIVKDGRFEEIE